MGPRWWDGEGINEWKEYRAINELIAITSLGNDPGRAGETQGSLPPLSLCQIPPSPAEEEEEEEGRQPNPGTEKGGEKAHFPSSEP